jgi:hypothetical protein
MLEELRVKARVAAIVVLLVVAIALPIVAIAKKGPPWGYRGHAAVLVEVTGAVELDPSEARRAKMGDGAWKPEVGLFLDKGDGIRVGRYSEARLRMPAGDVALGDDARIVVDEGGATGIELRLLRGFIEVTLPQGITPFEVHRPTHDGKITLRPGQAGGSFRIVSDGKEVRAWVRSGSAEAVVAGDANAETGKILVVNTTRVPTVIDGSGFAPTATCDNTKLVVTAPNTTQVFALKELKYPAGGSVSFDLPTARPAVPVYARDVTGAHWDTTVPCAAPPPSPPPRK